MSDYNFEQGGQPTQQMRPQSYQQPPMGYQQPPMGYQPRPPIGYGLMQSFGARRPLETKPFFLTSEFVFSLLAAILIAITAASSHAFGAWRAWILVTAIVVAYNISRGLAKAGTRSHASDPRENLNLGGHDSHDGHQGH